MVVAPVLRALNGNRLHGRVTPQCSLANAQLELQHGWDMIFRKRIGRGSRQGSKARELRRRRLANLASLTPTMETLEDRRLLAVFGGGGAITINDDMTATPYPSTIAVALANGVAADTVDVNVTLSGLSHTNPDDIDILLVGPAGGCPRRADHV